MSEIEQLRIIPTNKYYSEKLLNGETVNDITMTSNDVLLLPEERLHIHNLQLYVGRNPDDVFTFTLYSYHNEPFTQDDVYDKIMKKLPRFNVAMHDTTFVIVHIDVLSSSGDVVWTVFSTTDGVSDAFKANTPTLVSDIVTEV